MARFDTSNFREDAKMYSVVGTTSSGTEEAVQTGMVGKIGNRIVDDVYEFVPLESGDTECFYIATPEVDYDEEDFKKNSLYYFQLEKGAVTDAIQGVKHDKFSIAENGVTVPSSDTIVKNGYVYAKVGERKLQYSTTEPVSDVIQLAKIEDIVPATQGIVVMSGTKTNRALNQVQLNYNMLRCRIIK